MIEQFFPSSLSNVCCGIFLLALASFSQPCRSQALGSHSVTITQEAIPEPAIPAILKAFDTFEVVGMPAAHGQKDIDDLILSLVRDPRFPASVNDIVVECGNVRYQPILDRYIAGEDVPFIEVQHVWRDTTVQQMCGSSGFYEQLYPLVRSLNQHLPAASRLRVVAADPPIDWNKIQSYQDLTPFFDRDGSIASVMETEVLSKHRKALMLFGVFHLLHGGGPGEGDAVTRYERHYPGKTFIVISDPGYYGTGVVPLRSANAPGGVWPSLIRTKNSKLGSLSLDAFMDSPLTTDQDCNVVDAFARAAAKTIADQMDAILYLGPPESSMAEPLPADIALDRAYRAEWLRRMKLVGMPGPSLEEMDAQIVADAAHPVLTHAPRQPVSQEMKLRIRQSCLSTKQTAATTANAQNALPSPKDRDIHQIRREDDSDHPAQNTPEAISSYEERSRGRSQRVRAMLADGELRTQQDLYEAAFVLQHGETAGDYLLAHVLATDSLVKGNNTAKWLVAATLDRYLQLMSRPQIFGTQYPLDLAKPHPVSVEQMARFAGRTQVPYDDKFLTEDIRADFCVPSVTQQKQNLDTLNSGKYPHSGMLRAGCKR